MNDYGTVVDFYGCTYCHAGPGPVFPINPGIYQLRFLLPQEFLRMYPTWVRRSAVACCIVTGRFAFCREPLTLEGRKMGGLLSHLYVMEFCLSTKTPSILTDVFSWVSTLPSGNCVNSTSITPGPISSKSFSIQHSSFTPSLDANTVLY